MMLRIQYGWGRTLTLPSSTGGFGPSGEAKSISAWGSRTVIWKQYVKLLLGSYGMNMRTPVWVGSLGEVPALWESISADIFYISEWFCTVWPPSKFVFAEVNTKRTRGDISGSKTLERSYSGGVYGNEDSDFIIIYIIRSLRHMELYICSPTFYCAISHSAFFLSSV